jgi:ABC-type antimicrobial peptide transport system permease subunit
LLAVAAAVALGLSTVGIYGVMSSLVARSSAEIGIRIALGAAPTTIAGQVMRAIITLGSTGLTLGLLLGLTSIGPLKGYLFRVGSFDVAALTASALIGAGAGVGAGWLPARRAMRVDPASALRSE